MKNMYEFLMPKDGNNKEEIKTFLILGIKKEKRNHWEMREKTDLL